MNHVGTIFGRRAELRIYPDENDGTTFLTPIRPFIPDDEGMRVDMVAVSQAMAAFEREQYMRARLRGVRINGKVYAPDDVELLYEGDA
jgi:hypothetical protein